MTRLIQNRIRILVAESHDLIRIGLRSFVETQPLLQLVAETNNIDDLNELLAKHDPDLIFLDLKLSDGRCIQQIPQILDVCPQSRVLVFSGEMDQQIHLDALRLGAAGIFAKRQCTELLLKAIHAVHSGQVWFDRQIFSLVCDEYRPKKFPSKTDSEATLLTHQYCLTPRERSIGCLASNGLPAKMIGVQLSISEKTVRNQLTAVYEKLGVKSQVELCLKVAKINFCELNGLPCDRDKCPEKYLNSPDFPGQSSLPENHSPCNNQS